MDYNLENEFLEIVRQVIQKGDLGRMSMAEEARAHIGCPDQSVGIVKEACVPGEFKRANIIVDDYQGITDAAGRIKDH